MSVDYAEVSRMLGDDIEAVVAALGVDVRRRDARRLYCMSPFSGHAKPKLEIELTPRPGKWNDWSEGLWGDALGLVACLVGCVTNPKDKIALRQAVGWARNYFGLDDAGHDAAAWERRKAEVRERQALAARRAEEALVKDRRRAKSMWISAAPLRPGDDAWRYLLARGVDLAAFTRLPRAVRLAAAEPWFAEGEREPSHVGPALVSAMTLADGEFGAVHRTWINPLQPGQKADVDPPRKMWPASQGAAIRLWRGASNLNETQAAARGVAEDLVICEGVEDGLSIALIAPELRVVAVGSLPGMLAYAPPEHIRRVIVAADNDWGKPAAQQLLKRACDRLTEEFDKTVLIARSPEGKDFNDLLRGA